jgi:hypothetical protein
VLLPEPANAVLVWCSHMLLLLLILLLLLLLLQLLLLLLLLCCLLTDRDDPLKVLLGAHVV